MKNFLRGLLFLLLPLLAIGCGENDSQQSESSGSQSGSDVGQTELPDNGSGTSSENVVSEDVSGTNDSATTENPVPSGNPAAELAATHLKEALAWQDRYRAAEPEDRQAVLKERPSFAEYCLRFKKLAEENPDSAIACSAHVWMAENAPAKTDKSASLQTLVDQYPDNEELIELMIRLTRFRIPTAELEDRMKTLFERSSNRNVKAAARYGLLTNYNRTLDISRKIKADPANEARYQPEDVEYLKNFSIGSAELEGLYQTLVDDYQDVVLPGIREIRIGEFAESGLFRIQRLSIGGTAPEITGKDLDGVEFQLSDYRGNVVMLDFWGHW